MILFLLTKIRFSIICVIPFLWE